MSLLVLSEKKILIGHILFDKVAPIGISIIKKTKICCENIYYDTCQEDITMVQCFLFFIGKN